ncbi:MAG: iron ABC transporter permease [Clostridiales bacterium]|nr:iron ABC transporter permease [Clostridiales bacterium]MCD8132895.1 iron ABC transporter permease [Clostridiales bacterium]
MKYMEHGETIVEETRQADLKKSRVIYAGLGVAVIFLFLLSLCFKTSTPGFISPKETFIDLFTALRLFFSDLFNLPYSMDRSEIIASLPNYHISLTRLARTIMFCLSGMGVALAGAIFQTVYKNPMASPNIIGATVGVQLGNVLMITLYGTMAIYMPLTRYKYCYILTAIIVGGVLLMGKIAGGKRATYSVIEMVMAGSVVSQAFQVVTTYMMYNLEDDDLLTYQQLTMGTDIKTDVVSMSAFGIAMVASLLPMFLIRFRFNGAGFSMDEAKLQGINGVRLRMGGQVCGVIMVTAAMIHCGDVGMISMAVPHLARYLVGADFRRVSVCSMLFGAILMLGCRIVSSMIYIENTELPVNFIISLCIMPVFLVVLTRQRRGFE